MAVVSPEFQDEDDNANEGDQVCKGVRCLGISVKILVICTSERNL